MPVEPRKLRYLWAYSASDDRALAWHAGLLARRRARGFDVTGFCVTPPALSRCWLPFPRLHARWRAGDPALLNMYRALSEQFAQRDVLILYNGANLHPDFVARLGGLKVYTAGDDPESTDILTRPLAPAFDLHLVNNIACLDLYRSWDLRHVHFWPLGSQLAPDDPRCPTEAQVADATDRRVPIVFCGEREAAHRRGRLDELVRTFPQAFVAGRGWPRGFIAEDEKWAAYRRAQLGWNVHNSTGPVNFRTYDLPALGVLQLCDNRARLNDVFAVGREALGFDSVAECVELTHHYLAHPDEQRRIALAGWRRWQQDYTPDRVWDRLVAIVQQHLERAKTAGDAGDADVATLLDQQQRRGTPRRIWRAVAQRVRWVLRSRRLTLLARSASAAPAKAPAPSAHATPALAAPDDDSTLTADRRAPTADLAGREHWDDRYRRHADPAGQWSPKSYLDRCLWHVLGPELARCRPQSILEVGCGDSYWLPFVAQQCGAADVAGVDYSARGCALAQQRLAAAGVRGRVQQADVWNLTPAQLGQFDFVYSLGLVEHFTRPDAMLRHLARFVRPGGTLFTEVPNLHSLHGLLCWLWQPAVFARHRPIGERELRGMARRAGLRNVRGGRVGSASLGIVPWELEPRWPAVAWRLLRTLRNAETRVDRYLTACGRFNPLPGLAPLICIAGDVPRVAVAQPAATATTLPQSQPRTESLKLEPGPRARRELVHT